MKNLFYFPIWGLALFWALGFARPALAAQDKRLEVFSWWTSGAEARRWAIGPMAKGM